MDPHGGAFDAGPLTLAIALAAGMVAQALARHLRLPGIVLLLAAGAALGPEGAGVVRPATLGDNLHSLVGFAVAVILFEGGLNLNWNRLRREAKSIQRLVTVGALVTAIGGTLASRLIFGWDWRIAVLFGTLVIVTGPTVITPLLRRIRVTHKVATVLEAEGVLGDSIGAVTAVVALEVVISPSLESLAFGPWDLFSRLVIGVLVGALGGLAIAGLLRVRHVIPEGLENAFALSLALVVYQLSNAVYAESGIAAVTIAGIVVGNMQIHALRELREFKEQLTVLLIGMLFVLLAADISLAEVLDLGWPGVYTVLALMFIVRPLNVLVGTRGSDLVLREKLFMMWLAPRGIVAAAVSSLFAHTLEVAGIEGGRQLEAMVFLVIAITVVLQGLSGSLVAGWLGLRRESNTGYAVLGASSLGRLLARTLAANGEETVLIDSNHDACRAAEKEGFRVFHGSALSEAVLLRARLDSRLGVLAVTTNDELNVLFAHQARRDYGVPLVWVGMRKHHVSLTRDQVRQGGARVLFAAPRRMDLWSLRLDRKTASVQNWKREKASKTVRSSAEELFAEERHHAFLPLVSRRGTRIQPIDATLSFKDGDGLTVLVFDEQRVEGEEWLRDNGWRLLPPPEPPED